MKHNLFLSLGARAFACVPVLSLVLASPVLAQQPAAAPVKVHGHVTNPTGAAQGGGTVTYLATKNGAPAEPGQNNEKGVFPVDANGNYTGEVPPGTYTIVYRTEGLAKDKESDEIQGVVVAATGETAGDLDMSRQAFIDKLPEDQKKQLEELRKKNSEALKSNEVVKALNADLKVVSQDLKDADGAHAAAAQELGAAAARADVDAKTNEIKTAKYTDVETMMSKDTALRPTEPVLWAYLGQAQVGLKKYDDAEASYKKALETNAAEKKTPAIDGLADSGLGEIYARAGKVPEANAAFSAAAKANPPSAGSYLRNQAVIFFQMGNADAQVAAANIAIANDPNDALVYYLKGQGLVNKATIDPKTQRIELPAECEAAYQKYLELAPTGLYAAEVQSILSQAGTKINSTYKAGKK
ncbi:MAG TPA: hypothetical protein VE291_11865 [Terracidiphilus sp.]|jgi:tetratricopeptide (TPR) repeat protein|nr:hypothetical protein [Terracidiphilus sp.]